MIGGLVEMAGLEQRTVTEITRRTEVGRTETNRCSGGNGTGPLLYQRIWAGGKPIDMPVHTHVGGGHAYSNGYLG